MHIDINIIDLVVLYVLHRVLDKAIKDSLPDLHYKKIGQYALQFLDTVSHIYLVLATYLIFKLTVVYFELTLFFTNTFRFDYFFKRNLALLLTLIIIIQLIIAIDIHSKKNQKGLNRLFKKFLNSFKSIRIYQLLSHYGFIWSYALIDMCLDILNLEDLHI